MTPLQIVVIVQGVISVLLAGSGQVVTYVSGINGTAGSVAGTAITGLGVVSGLITGVLAYLHVNAQTKAKLADAQATLWNTQTTQIRAGLAQHPMPTPAGASIPAGTFSQL